MKNITCFLPLGTPEETRQTVAELQKSPLIEKLLWFANPVSRLKLKELTCSKPNPSVPEKQY